MIDISLLQEFAGMFILGIKNTLLIACGSCCLGIFLGIVAGIILSAPSSMFRWFVTTYVTIIRGTPMLIQVAATYYLLRGAGYPITAFWSAILSIGLNSGAYMSQIVFAGIKSVPKGQVEAAKVLGFSDGQIMWYIVLPQAIRTVVPAFGNELITLIKDSSLASTIGVYELTKQGEIVITQTFDAPTVYVALGIMYLIITSLVSLLVSSLDKKLHHHA